MAKILIGSVLISDEDRAAIERAAREMPADWTVKVVGNVTPPGVVDVTVEGPANPTYKVFNSNRLDEVPAFLDVIRLSVRRS